MMIRPIMTAGPPYDARGGIRLRGSRDERTVLLQGVIPRSPHPAVAPQPDLAHLDTVNPQPLQPPSEPPQEPVAPPPPGPPVQRPQDSFARMYETREVGKARERADRAARRADRAARRVHEAQERAAGQRPGARQLVDVAGGAGTAPGPAAADEAQARLAAKARMRELEHAVVTARAGGSVDVSPPTRDEALKLVDR